MYMQIMYTKKTPNYQDINLLSFNVFYHHTHTLAHTHSTHTLAHTAHTHSTHTQHTHSTHTAHTHTQHTHSTHTHTRTHIALGVNIEMNCLLDV